MTGKTGLQPDRALWWLLYNMWHVNPSHIHDVFVEQSVISFMKT